MAQPERLRELGDNGHRAWAERYTWAVVARRYEKILMGEA
jgi:hypothetical protein